MKVLKKQIPILLMLLSISLICANCEKENKVAYYPAIGIGYVFQKDSMGNSFPAKDVNVEVLTSDGIEGNPDEPWISGGWRVNYYLADDTYITDAKGCYRVRFLKSKETGHRNSIPSTFSVNYAHSYYFVCNYNCHFILDDKKVGNAKETLLLDTIFIK